MSITLFLRLVSEPEDVACEAEDGRMIWTALREDIATDVALANEGLRMAAVRGSRSDAAAPSTNCGRATPGDSGIVSKFFVWTSEGLLLGSFGGLARYAGVVAIEDSAEEEGFER